MDIYFPLFEELLDGRLAPYREENADGLSYARKLQKMRFTPVRYEEAYRLDYPKPMNAKCTYYRQLLTMETSGYCADVKAGLAKEQSKHVLHYRRKQLLDDHLTTCLMRLGHLMREKGYFEEAAGDSEFQSNAYVYHLLKICLVKAYLEIQEALQQVVERKLNEKLLRTSIVQEPFPFDHYLTRQDRLMAQGNESLVPGAMDATAVGVQSAPYYTMKQVCELLQVSDSTVTRRVEQGVIVARKEGKRYLFEKSVFDRYLQNLPAKKSKPDK